MADKYGGGDYEKARKVMMDKANVSRAKKYGGDLHAALSAGMKKARSVYKDKTGYSNPSQDPTVKSKKKEHSNKELWRRR